MNLLSRFLGRPQTRELATIIPGELSISRPKNSPKGSFELLYRDAELVIVEPTPRRDATGFALIVRKLVDDSLKSDEVGDARDEREFVLDEALKLGYAHGPNDTTIIIWRDLSEGTDDRYEFKCGSTVTARALSTFLEVAQRGQHLRKYGHVPPERVDSGEFDFEKLYSQPNNLERDKSINRGNLDTEASTKEATEGSKPSPNLVIHPFTEGRVLAKERCELGVFDPASENFIVTVKNVTAVVLDQNLYRYWLEVRNDEGALLGSPINESLSPYSHMKKSSIIFNSTGENGVPTSYLLHFTGPEAAQSLSRFEETIAIAIWEKDNQRRWTEIPEADQQYITEAMANTSVYDESMSDSSSDLESESEEESEAESRDGDLDRLENFSSTSGIRTMKASSALEVGHVRDRSYVVRGNQIGVFKHTDRSIDFQTTINAKFDPAQLMLHEADTALVLRDADNPTSFHKMDLETGKIVEEWSAGEKELRYLAPTSKFAQTTAEQTLYGVSGRSMFRLDPRQAGTSKLVTSDCKSYASNTKFSSLATTESGYIVVSSDTGDIGLYKNMGQRARTHIPSLGQPIIGVDVTADGRYVLATTKEYLLLVETVTDENNGFTKSWARDRKPRPLKLMISPENMYFMRQQTGKSVSFTTARFNTGKDVRESSIVTSTGPYLVTWNLSKVLRGDQNAYLMKRYDSDVTAENFKFGTDKKVIVTLENDVGMVSKTALRRPNHQVLVGEPTSRGLAKKR